MAENTSTRDQAWALVKTAIFTIVVPGTVVVWLPLVLGLVDWSRRRSPALFATGLVVLGIGILIYLSCAFSFAWTGRGTPSPTAATRTLVVAGLYQYCRNPMYWGVLLALASEFVLFGRSPAASAIYIALFLVAVNLFIRFYEEPTLRKQFGPEYEEYCRSVPRWIPAPHRAMTSRR